MNWRDPPMKEHMICAWYREHEYSRRTDTCYQCGLELWARYKRTVWANRREIFVRKFHVECF